MRRHSHILTLAIALATSPSFAATVNWVGGSNSNAWSAGANWNGNSGNAPTNDTTTDIASFTASSYISKLPNLDASRSVNGVSFSGSGSLTFSANSGASLTLGSSGITMQSTAGSVTIAAPLVLANSQTWLNNSSNPLSLSGGLTANANLALDGTGSIAFSNIAISGNGSLTKNGTGSLTLHARDSFTGGFNLNAGTIIVSGTSATGSGAFIIGNATGSTAVTINPSGVASLNTVVTLNQNLTLGGPSAGSLSLSGSVTLAGATRQITVTPANSSLTINAPINDAGNTLGLTKTGSGALSLNNANLYTGTTTLSAGLLTAANPQALGDNAPLLLTGGTLWLSIDTSINGYNTTINGIVTIVPSRLNPGATITHSLGTLAIGASTLTVATSSSVTGIAALTFSNTTLSADGTIFDTAAATLLTLGTLSGNFAFTKQGTGQLTLNSASSRAAGQVTLSNGTLLLAHPAALGDASVPLTLSGGTLNLATDTSIHAHNTTITANTIIVPDRVSPGTITHILGTLAIGAATLTVGTSSNVSSATLAFGNTTLTNDATIFDIPANANLTLGALSGNFTLTKQNTGQLTLTSPSPRTSGIVTLTQGKFLLNDPAALGSSAVSLTLNGGTLDLATDSTVNAHNISIATGAGTLTTILADRLTTGTAITHSLGNLSIGSRTVTLDKGSNVTSGAPTIAFNAVSISGNAVVNTATGVNATLASISASSNLSITFNSSGNTTVSGTILTSGGTLTKAGGGIMTVQGTSSPFGTIRLQNGALQTNGNTIPAAFFSLEGGVLQTTGITAFTRSIAASGSSAFQWNSTTTGGGFSARDGKLTVTVANNSSTELAWGTAIFGTLKFGSATANAETEFTNLINLNATTRSIDVTAGAGNDYATLSNVIRNSTGTAGLTKTGSGTLRLSAINTYNGPTAVSAGTLLVDGTLTSSAVSVANAATLGGIGVISSTTQLANGATLNPGSISGLGTLTLAALTLDPGSIVHFDLTSTSAYDRLLYTTLSAPGAHTLEVALTSPTPLTPGDIFQLFNHPLPSGTFATFNLPAAYTWNTDLLTSTGQVSIQAVAIPEPSPLPLLATTLLPIAALLWSRRRHKACRTPSS